MLYNDSYRPRFISLKVIMDRVMSRPNMEDLPYDVAVLATIDCVELIGNSLFMAPGNCLVHIKDYRGELPENIVNVKKVVKVDNNDNFISMTTNNDPFSSSYKRRSENSFALNYKIQGGYIQTNFETGRVNVAYEAIPVDTDGIPMIPDRASILKAVEYSIIREWFERKVFAGRLGTDKLQYADRERNWYVSKVSTDFMLENLDRKQNLANILNTLLISGEHYSNNFGSLGEKEHIRRH